MKQRSRSAFSERARIAANTRWAFESDRSAATQKMRDTQWEAT